MNALEAKRLFRRLKSLGNDLDWPFESCMECGKSFRIAWRIKDRLWRRVVGEKHAGCLCLDCFVARASQAGVVIKPIDIEWLALFDPPFQIVNIIGDPEAKKKKEKLVKETNPWDNPRLLLRSLEEDMPFGASIPAVALMIFAIIAALFGFWPAVATLAILAALLMFFF